MQSRIMVVDDELDFLDTIRRGLITSGYRNVVLEAELYAACDAPLLINEEPGTGKKMLSQAIHSAGTRSEKPFTMINMDTLDKTHFAVLLFGQVKDADAGLENDRTGCLEGTHRGTLLLQNIESLPIDLQGQLLSVLQKGEYIKIGDNRPERSDIRVITATHANLEELVLKDRFRTDLYHHLKGGWIHIPPLRRRKGDIPLLIEHFSKKSQQHVDKFEITSEALTLLLDYAWPGNIDELKDIAEFAADLSRGAPLSPEHLPGHLVNPKAL